MLVAFLVSAPSFATPTDGQEIVVYEQSIPALIGIDPVTGQQRMIKILSAAGFAYDPARGVLWVVSGAELDEVNLSTGDQTYVAAVLDGSVLEAVAVASDGSLFVAGAKYNLDGTASNVSVQRIVPVFGSNGSISVLAQGGLLSGARPWAVEVDQTGAPIVSTLGPPSEVIRVDPVTGAQTLIAQSTDRIFRDFAIQGNTALIAISTQDVPNSMDEVDRLDLTTGQLTTLFGGLQRVLDVDLDSQGRMVILDQCEFLSPCAGAGSPVVYRSNNSGGLDVLSTDGYMLAPGRLAIIPASLLPPPLLPDCRNGKIQVGETCDYGNRGDDHIFLAGNVSVNSTGTIGEYTTSGERVNASLITGLIGPTDIAVSGSALFVLDARTGTIGEYTTPSGETVNASLITGLSGPSSIAVSGRNLFVANVNGTIGEYTTSGETVNASLIGGLGFQICDFSGRCTYYPISIAVSGSNLFVADGLDGTIGEYATSGETVNASLITGLYQPRSIAVSGTNLFVANANGTIGEYTTSGETVNASLITGLPLPSSIAVSGTNLLVANYGSNTIGEYTTSGATVNASLITSVAPAAIAVGGGATSCGTGPELVMVAPLLMWLRSRRRRRAA